MNQSSLEQRAEELTALVADLGVVDACYLQQNQIVLSLHLRFDPLKSTTLLKDRLRLAGYRFTLSLSDDTLLLSVSPHRKLTIPKLNIFLFFVTLASVYLVPVFYFNILSNPTLASALTATLDDLAHGRGLEFTLALISILLVHEMAHFVASRRRGIITSWPYFIPAPNLIGTFGAIIKSKSPFWNRRDLIEVGAAGPIAGWVVAIGWLVYGLTNSAIISEELAAFSGMAFTLDGESILIKALVPWLIGPAPSGSLYAFSEAAFAGWVGLLVTALNMLPIGQLDGGHVLYGLTPRKQATLGWIALAGLLVLGFQSSIWWIFGGLAFVMGVVHPPTLDDQKPPPRTARILGWLSLVILLLSFTPVPFQ